jgi:hypothetical protein
VQWEQARRNRATLDMRVAMKASDRDALQSFVAQTAAAETECERLRERAMAVLEQELWELNVRIAAAKTSTSLTALQVSESRRAPISARLRFLVEATCRLNRVVKRVGAWEGYMLISFRSCGVPLRRFTPRVRGPSEQLSLFAIRSPCSPTMGRNLPILIC